MSKELIHARGNETGTLCQVPIANNSDQVTCPRCLEKLAVGTETRLVLPQFERLESYVSYLLDAGVHSPVEAANILRGVAGPKHPTLKRILYRGDVHFNVRVERAMRLLE